MSRFSKSFLEFCVDHDLDILTNTQKQHVLSEMHICASASGIALDPNTLVVNGGNLRYYAGLEYNSPVLEAVTDTDCYRVYELSGKRDNVFYLHRACMAILKGQPIDYSREEVEEED